MQSYITYRPWVPRDGERATDTSGVPLEMGKGYSCECTAPNSGPFFINPQAIVKHTGRGEREGGRGNLGEMRLHVNRSHRPGCCRR